MKKILVTGCNGQLGRAIRKEYAASDVEFINTDVVAGNGIVSLDITNIDAVMEMVKDTKPDIIMALWRWKKFCQNNALFGGDT